MCIFSKLVMISGKKRKKFMKRENKNGAKENRLNMTRSHSKWLFRTSAHQHNYYENPSPLLPRELLLTTFIHSSMLLNQRNNFISFLV